MKRHHQRTAQNILTLSLLSGLTLLAACGGGGGGGGAPAAPAAVVEVKVPTLAEETDTQEPYIAAPSSYVRQVTTGSYIAQFQLNILDGGSQTVLTKIDHGSEPLTGQWTVTHKFDRSTPGAEVDLGAQTLYFIQKVGDQHQVFQMDLSRDNKDLSYKRISSIADACRIVNTYPVNRDGSQTALIIDTAGTKGVCGSNDPGASEQDKLDASDNVLKVVKTDDATGTDGRQLIDPTAKTLAPLYTAGVLTGVLVQHPDPVTPSQAQMDILGPTLDTRLVSGIIIPGSTSPAYLIDPTKPEVGAEWIADMPAEAGGGYLHIQDLTTKVTVKDPISGKTTSSIGFNRLYRLHWDNTTNTASLEDQEYSLGVGAKSNKGFTDDKFVYIPDGNYLAYGPDPTADAPISIFSVYTGGTANPISNASPLTINQVTEKSILLSQKTSTQNLLFYIDKATRDWNVISNNPNTVVYGVRGNYLYYGVPMDGSPTYRLLKYNLTPDTASYNVTKPLQTNVTIMSQVWNKTLNHGQYELSTLVMCAPTNGFTDNCLRETLKTYDLDNEKYDIELGNLAITDSNNITTTSQVGLGTANNLFTIDKVISGGYKFKEDPWLFHPKVPQSLKLISTIDTSTTSPTTN